MIETDRQIGIILEYASGGELFDYILNHRYLKDNAARRLFAQLVSGVGYLHKKGIVHRDLKLENLLLDRNRNIIITDFGFANTFNPDDELGEEVEYNLSSREYVKQMELDKILPNGLRRGDLMQTSCGSPCYAAPELVVSESLYTGRKVDVWSCGVILVSFRAVSKSCLLIFFSTLCSLATYLSMTTQPIPRVITSTSSTSTLFRLLLPSPNTSPLMLETYSAEFSSQTLESAPTSLKLLGIVG
jgi:protein-serine/threonine kinase